MGSQKQKLWGGSREGERQIGTHNFLLLTSQSTTTEFRNVILHPNLRQNIKKRAAAEAQSYLIQIHILLTTGLLAKENSIHSEGGGLIAEMEVSCTWWLMLVIPEHREVEARGLQLSLDPQRVPGQPGPLSVTVSAKQNTQRSSELKYIQVVCVGGTTRWSSVNGQIPVLLLLGF